ncbi:stereocilin-like [Acipenser ruthenus]|uniref:stereocilin-like n=1 Tax=Acipenser ruthenus TaxID=7906 RepID=UPI0027429558|nr:stereocilin-like [Acipenser ruthenus]
MAVLLPLLVVLLLKEPVHSSGDRSAKLVGVWKDVASLWRRGGVWDPRREQEPLAGPQGRRIQTVVSNIMDGLHTLGLLPRKSMSLPPPLSPPSSPLDRNRLSGFLYNISMYLQGSGGEPEAGAGPFPSDQAREQFWGNMLYSLLQPEGGAGLDPTEEKVPPRPSFRILELFLSLRGSQHWDGLLGLVQTVMSLFERQQLRPLLAFLRQNWDTISALLETALQALVSSTYGQASAGLQGFLCALSGHTDCGFNLDWLQQLFRFMEARNWKPVVSFLPGIGSSGGPQGDSPPFERFKPFSVLPGALKGDPLASSQSQPDSRGLGSVQTLLLQALSQSNEAERTEPVGEPDPALWQRLDGLQQGLLRRVGSSVYASLKRKVARVTVSLLGDVSALVGVPKADHDGKCSVGDLRQLLLWGIRNNITWNAQALGFTSQGLPSRPPFMSCSPAGEGRARRREAKRGAARRESRQHGGAVGRPRVLNPEEEERGEADFPLPTEILEAACNDSIPGLTGVSNFTVFLYCNLFDGGGSAREPEAGQAGLDLRATCSDAAWYLSAAEDDFLWVQVCSEFFTSEFNNTVCANSSFWQQRAHSQAAAVKDYYTYNQSSIDELCVQLSGNVSEHSGTEASEDCLTHLGVGALSVQNFRRCFLPNDSVLIWALCGNVTLLEEGSWAANFCSKSRQNSSHVNVIKETCDYRSWPPGSFGNATLLEQCQGAEGLREHICRNTTFYHRLVTSHPWLLGYCADPEANPEDDRCFLHKIFDMLPATYDFDSSQLCQNPAPYLLDALYQLSQCEGAVEERHGWIDSVNYVLRVVDFIVALKEGEREVRQVLGEAILLSSLLDNTSFWATFRPSASLSVLQTVGVFLKTEQNLTLKEDLLSCFSPVLWDLIQREHNSSALRVLFQEYLQMPQDNFRTLLMSAENDAVKRFLSHMHQTWDQLQVVTPQVSQQDEQAMETMTSAFIHKFPRVTPDLFVDLSQFIPFMSVSDIMSFPASLLVNDSVLTAIRDHSPEMKASQKRAFVKRLLQSHLFEEVPSWPPYFLSSILPLLPHLPLSHFQQLTAEQLNPLVEVLGNSSLDSTRGHHLMRTVFNKKRNLTADDVKRLGALLCSVNPEDLRPLLSARPLPSLLRERLLQCVSDGLTSATGRLSHWLLLALRPLNASVLTTPELASLHGILPQLGASFLQSLPTPRLLDVLADPDLADFPPAQAFQLLTEIIQNTNLSVASLCRLRPLRSGLSPSVLRTLSPPSPWGSSCDCWRSLLSELSPAQRAAALDSLRPLMNGSQSWPLQMSCLVPYVPLKELALDGAAVLRNSALYRHLPWSTQQAQFLLRKTLQSSNLTKETVMTLGNIAGGLGCDWLRLWANDSDFTELLRFLSDLPGGVRASLRKCIIEEIQKRPVIDLDQLAPQFSADLPVRMIESLSNATLASILEHITKHFPDFLRLPPHKQSILAEKARLILVSVFSQGGILGVSMDLLGPLLPFLDLGVLGVHREALLLRLDEVKGYCLPRDALPEIGQLLTERGMLGETLGWTLAQMEHAGRLLFTLSPQEIHRLPTVVVSPDSVEQVLDAQRRWKGSEVGRACMRMDREREKKESLVTRVVHRGGKNKKDPIPSCADIKGTFPAAWSAAQLSGMLEPELRECVETLGQDRELSSEQRRAVWARFKQIYGPIKTMRAEQILQLGCIVTQLSERELQELDLSNLGILAYLGGMEEWSPKQMRVTVLRFLRGSGQTVEGLGVTELASLGFLLCGMSPSEMGRLDPRTLSAASLFLGELPLRCSELQSETLATRLMTTEAFGPVSEWGPEVFTEIGTLAAGLSDMVLSSLVREQLEGLTPAAIALIAPRKLAVVLSTAQLSWMTPEQAGAVTPAQWAELSSDQSQAVAMAQYEGELMQDPRGRSLAPTQPSPDSTAVWLLALGSVLCALV